jgi:hypothetical protein
MGIKLYKLTFLHYGSSIDPDYLKDRENVSFINMDKIISIKEIWHKQIIICYYVKVEEAYGYYVDKKEALKLLSCCGDVL